MIQVNLDETCQSASAIMGPYAEFPQYFRVRYETTCQWIRLAEGSLDLSSCYSSVVLSLDESVKCQCVDTGSSTCN